MLDELFLDKVFESNDGKYKVYSFLDTESGYPDYEAFSIVDHRDGGEDFLGFVGKYIDSEQIDAAYFTFDRETFERYLRIFHGTSDIAWYVDDSMQITVVTFDTAQWRDNHSYSIPFVAKEYQKEIIDVVEGQVYGLALVSLTDGQCGHKGCKDHQDYVVIEAIAGFYGKETLEFEAEEYFGYLNEMEN